MALINIDLSNYAFNNIHDQLCNYAVSAVLMCHTHNHTSVFGETCSNAKYTTVLYLSLYCTLTIITEFKYFINYFFACIFSS